MNLTKFFSRAFCLYTRALQNYDLNQQLLQVSETKTSIGMKRLKKHTKLDCNRQTTLSPIVDVTCEIKGVVLYCKVRTTALQSYVNTIIKFAKKFQKNKTESVMMVFPLKAERDVLPALLRGAAGVQVAHTSLHSSTSQAAKLLNAYQVTKQAAKLFGSSQSRKPSF